MEEEPEPKVSRSLMIRDEQQQNPLSSFLKGYKKAIIPRIAALNTEETDQSSESENSEYSQSESIQTSSDEEIQMEIPDVKTEEYDPMEATPSATAPPPFQFNNGKYTFTLDDIPSTKWSQRFQEFQSWMETQKLTRESNFDILSDLSPGLLDFSETGGIHQDDLKVLKKREFFERKCCSPEKKDLQRHFMIMTKLFYFLGADPNLKHTILASIPEILQNAVLRSLQKMGKRVENLTIGEIQQETYMVLEEICDKKKVIKYYLTGSKEIARACHDTKLQIKCKEKKDCNCRRKGQSKRRNYQRPFRTPAFPRSLRRKRKWRYLRKKQSRGQKSSRCYICGQSGHFAKRCPKNRQGAKMIQMIQQKTGIQIDEEDDVESIFSIDDEPNDNSLFAIQSLEDSKEDTDSSTEEIYMLQGQISSSTTIASLVPAPHVPISIYLDKYDKATDVIAFIDTGAAKTIMNPDILPSHWWKPHIRKFPTASSDEFVTRLISKPITIQFFPGCSVRTKVLGSKLTGKDLVVGFDLYRQAKLLRIIPDGIRYRQMFKPFVDISRLFLVQPTEEIKVLMETLKNKSCAESHEDFLSKCDHPLWKNPEFYVKLPFKKNEDINPTKASHTGMNPEHQRLAEAECNELIQQGLIEPSNSQWACEAFYVNKRSEQARGKLRLVINYQPLNHFLLDDKFPLPNRNALFSSLAKAQIFSKFDLKAGFWQLGIDPIDRPKTGFCIPNQHFQWRVMPFGLKTTPSLFQKAMVRIFQPIMDQALIYIDDILLYSPDEESHLKLLKHFSQLVAYYGVMLYGSSEETYSTVLGDSKLSSRFCPKDLQIYKSSQKDVEEESATMTDASDKYWGAILFEEKNKKRYLCGYKSGRFSDAEIHYHSTFKEILAVKKAISKFEFHLIGHHFLVEMDMSSFPQMLRFKQKTVPHPQLLRWAEWFSKFSFDCKHIKGKTNVLADLLTRPKIMMYRASSSQDPIPKKKQRWNSESAFNIPPNLNPEFPPEVYRLVLENQFHSKARDMIFEIRVPDELKWLLWYLTHIYQIAIQFILSDLQYFIDEAIQGTEPEISRNLAVVLKWFFPLSYWKDMVDQAILKEQGHFIIIIFYKPQYFIHHGNAKQLGSFPSAHIHSIQWEDVRKREGRYRALQRHMCQINRQIPKEIWPPPKEHAPWDAWPEDPALLTSYHRAIMEAQKQYKDKIPDPTEWSQDYPWFESSASKRPKEDSNDHMDTEEGNDSTSTDSAQLPFSNRD
ncbi:hypothetical protein GQ457_03G000800 [Hibiscus cannabinus]